MEKCSCGAWLIWEPFEGMVCPNCEPEMKTTKEKGNKEVEG